MIPTDARPGVRLTVPADLAHAPLIRSCVRDALTFASDHHESSFLVALTEVVVNAVAAAEEDTASPIVIELFGLPDAHVVVSNVVGHVAPDRSGPDELGAGLSIAAAFVADLCVDTDRRGTRVRIGL